MSLYNNLFDHLLNFLSIRQIAIFARLSKSSYLIYEQSKYYSEMVNCKECKDFSFREICRCGNVFLLEKALIEFEYTDEDLAYGLSTKCANGELDCIKLFFRSNLSFSENTVRDILYIAIEEERIEIIDFLIRRNLYKINELFHLACTYGKLGSVIFFVEDGAQVESDDNKAICIAAEHGYANIVMFLIQRGANVMARKNFPLRSAWQNGHLETVMVLIKYGANLQDGRLPKILVCPKDRSRYLSGLGSHVERPWDFFNLRGIKVYDYI